MEQLSGASTQMHTKPEPTIECMVGQEIRHDLLQVDRILTEDPQLRSVFDMLEALKKEESIKIRYWNSTKLESFQTANRMVGEGLDLSKEVTPEELKQAQHDVKVYIAQEIARMWKYHTLTDFLEKNVIKVKKKYLINEIDSSTG